MKCVYCRRVHSPMGCKWTAYNAGYAVGQTLYQPGNYPGPDHLEYGYRHYRKRGKLRDGYYEQGIADALQPRVKPLTDD